MTFDSPAVVLDCGSCFWKAGRATDESPKVFPSLVGELRKYVQKTCMAFYTDNNFVGKRAEQVRGILHLRQPVERGIIRNWEYFEQMLDYAFLRELSVDPQGETILYTEGPRTSMQQRERIVELLFEMYDCGALHMGKQPVFSLYNAHEVTGIIVDCGHGATHVVPIYEGALLSYAVRTLPLGGQDVRDFLAMQLRGLGTVLSSSSEYEVSGRIVKDKCRVSEQCFNGSDSDSEDPLYSTQWGCFELPDGQVLELEPRTLQAPEILFRPSLTHSESPGLHELVYECIMKCDIDLRAELYGKIHVTGGMSLCPGFIARLENEVRRLVPLSAQAKVRVLADPDRLLAAWQGAAVQAQSPYFAQMCITRSDYLEHGPSAILRAGYT